LFLFSELLKQVTLSDEVQEKILEKNIRGRESFRRLLSLKTDEQRLKEIDQFSQEPHSKMVKASSLGSRSLLRIAISTDGIKIQKGKLSNLSQSEKQSVKNALVENIDSLKN
jgi:hypothetical protein